MSTRRIVAIFKKQIKDTLKNKVVMIQFIMYPAMAIIMENAIKVNDLPPRFFVIMFAAMYVGMTPLISMSSILSEEKETNTLRVLLMSNVKAGEYLLGVGIYIWFICMLGTGVFALVGGYSGEELVMFFVTMSVGIITSIIMGAAIGVFSKNQMSATSITVPVMIVCAFTPMISTFNESVKTVSRFLYSQQIHNMLNRVNEEFVSMENLLVIGMNMIIVISIFAVAYRKSKF